MPVDATSPPTSPYSLLAGADKNLRLTAGAVARIDGVIVGTYRGRGTHAISEDFLQQVTRILALRCAQLSPNQRTFRFSETTCSEKVNFHVGMDKEARIYLVAVEKTYPTRVALLAVDEFAEEWKESKSSTRSLTCMEDGCRSAVRECVSALARRYEDVGANDQLTRVQAGVEGVREQMQVNITKALEGLQTTEEIMVRSEELRAGAMVFKKQTVTLKKMVWWQKAKNQFILAGLIVAVVVLLGVWLGTKFRKK